VWLSFTEWSYANGPHGVRDAVFLEDRSTIYRGHASQKMVALRNAVIASVRAAGTGSLAATGRSFRWNPQRLIALPGSL